MSHADRPYLTRPLAGVDQALGEGRARQPVELLDQLRERLNRLDPNHPSARPRPADGDEALGRDAASDQDAAADVVADYVPTPEESARASRPDSSSLQKEGTDASRDDRLGDQAAGEPPAVRNAGPLGVAAADGTVSGLAGDGQYRVVETGQADKGERYRPWFAADEPATPWFAE